MDLRSLESFISAAHHLNFSNAAIDCHVTQATLSRQIAALEEEIGTDLFVRHKNGVSLTPAGQYLFSCSYSLVEQHKDIISNCRRAVYDLLPKLRIGMGPYEHYLLNNALTVLHKQFPVLDISCMSYTHKILTTRFRNNSIDLALCTERCANTVDYWETIPVYQEPWQVVASVDHPFWELPKAQQEILENQTLIISYNNEFEETVQYCKKNHLKPAHFIESNFLQSQIPLLKAGMGIALLPPFIKEFLPDGLIMKDVLASPMAPTIVFTYDKRTTHPAIQTLIEHFQKNK